MKKTNINLKIQLYNGNLKPMLIKMSEIQRNRLNNYKISNQCLSNEECQSYEFCNIDPKAGNSCLSCAQDCVNCLSKTECTRCGEGRVIVSGICRPCEKITVGLECQCGNLKYANCKACDKNGCSQCLSEYFVDAEDKCSRQVCITDNQCQSGQYCQIVPNGTNKCQKCSNNCLICNSSTCLECQDKFKIVNGECIQNECDDTKPCPSTKFCEISDNLQNKCTSCPINCAKCSLSTTCEICENNFYESSVNRIKICLPCSDNIDEFCTCGEKQIQGCSRCGVDKCVQCLSEKYFLQDGGCIRQCISNGECINGQICNIDPNIVNKCVDCQIGCLKCTSLTQCDLCPSGNFSINGTCKDCSMIENDSSCQCTDKLISHCSRCGLKSTCLSCQSRYILVGGLCVLGDCDLTITCKNGQYCQIIDSTIPNKCVNCDEGCYTCNQYFCVVCQENYYLINGSCFKDECDEIIHCQDGQFCQIIENSQNKCIVCRHGCSKCTETTCQECDIGFKLIDDQCIQNICDDKILCQKGQFCQMIANIPNKCVFCDQTCQDCNSTICFSCISGYKLIDQVCIQNECDDIIQCKIGQYCQINEKVENYCIQCQTDCSYCDSNTCQQCFVGYKLINQMCLKNDCDDRTSCQEGFFCSVQEDKINTCIDCSYYPALCHKSETALFLFIAGIVSGVVAILITIIVIIIIVKISKRNKKQIHSKRQKQKGSNMMIGSQV